MIKIARTGAGSTARSWMWHAGGAIWSAPKYSAPSAGTRTSVAPTATSPPSPGTTAPVSRSSQCPVGLGPRLPYVLYDLAGPRCLVTIVEPVGAKVPRLDPVDADA